MLVGGHTDGHREQDESDSHDYNINKTDRWRGKENLSESGGSCACGFELYKVTNSSVLNAQFVSEVYV